MSSTSFLSKFNFTNNLSIKDINENFQTFIIFFIICVILIVFILYVVYLKRLENSECSYMNQLYPSLNGYIKPLNSNNPDCSGNLYDYYIKTAYNACSGGSYKNDFVDICNLKAIIKQGVRCLDFEIYSVNDTPIVSTSTKNDFHIKETFNSVDFSTVMQTIENYAFSTGTTPNSTDPLIIHLRIKSNNSIMYSNLANIFKQYEHLMLGSEYSFENSGKNLGSVPLLTFQNKIILIIDRTNTTFLQNEQLLEFVNLTSNSVFMRKYNFYDIKNNPDTNELTEFDKRGMTIVLPDIGENPPNPNGLICRVYGCQLIAMRFQYVDNYLMENNTFFDNGGYAFILKPIELRYQIVSIPAPIQQNDDYSYKTKNIQTDYYNFNF